MSKAKTAKLDEMDPNELAQFIDTKSVLIPGRPYLFLMGFGWGYVGYYVKHLSPNRIMVAHCSHFRNAGKDYGRLIMEGAGPECEWRYEGPICEMNLLHSMKNTPYHGKVHRG